MDSSPLENHDDLREAFTWFEQLPSVRCRYIWSRSSPVPEALSVQGAGAPPALFGRLGELQHLMGRNEYIVFIMVVEAATLDQNAIYHVIMTRNALAQVETGKELLAKVKALVLDADEEIAAGGLDSGTGQRHNPDDQPRGRCGPAGVPGNS